MSWPKCCAHRTKSRHKRRLQSFCQCNGASINVVGRNGYRGDVLVYLVVYNQCWQATGCPYALPNNYTAAKPAVSTPRQPRESDSYVCAFRLPAPATEVGVSTVPRVRNGVECRRVPCAYVPFDVRAAMFLGVVARQARSCCGVSCCISCLQLTSIPDTNFHSDSLSPVHHEQFQPPLACPQT